MESSDFWECGRNKRRCVGGGLSDKALEEFEKQFLQTGIRRSGGNQCKAPQLLHITATPRHAKYRQCEPGTASRESRFPATGHPVITTMLEVAENPGANVPTTKAACSATGNGLPESSCL